MKTVSIEPEIPFPWRGAAIVLAIAGVVFVGMGAIISSSADRDLKARNALFENYIDYRPPGFSDRGYRYRVSDVVFNEPRRSVKISYELIDDRTTHQRIYDELVRGIPEQLRDSALVDASRYSRRFARHFPFIDDDYLAPGKPLGDFVYLVGGKSKSKFFPMEESGLRYSEPDPKEISAGFQPLNSVVVKVEFESFPIDEMPGMAFKFFDFPPWKFPGGVTAEDIQRLLIERRGEPNAFNIVHGAGSMLIGLALLVGAFWLYLKAKIAIPLKKAFDDLENALDDRSASASGVSASASKVGRNREPTSEPKKRGTFPWSPHHPAFKNRDFERWLRRQEFTEGEVDEATNQGDAKYNEAVWALFHQFEAEQANPVEVIDDPSEDYGLDSPAARAEAKYEQGLSLTVDEALNAAGFASWLAEYQERVGREFDLSDNNAAEINEMFRKFKKETGKKSTAVIKSVKADVPAAPTSSVGLGSLQSQVEVAASMRTGPISSRLDKARAMRGVENVKVATEHSRAVKDLIEAETDKIHAGTQHIEAQQRMHSTPERLSRNQEIERARHDEELERIKLEREKIEAEKAEQRLRREAAETRARQLKNPPVQNHQQKQHYLDSLHAKLKNVAVRNATVTSYTVDALRERDSVKDFIRKIEGLSFAEKEELCEMVDADYSQTVMEIWEEARRHK